MNAIGAVFYLFVVLPFGVAWSGYVLSILWGWFLVPVFAVPVLSVPAAIGVALVVSYLTHQFFESCVENEGRKDFTKRIWHHVGFLLFKPAIALLMGWIVMKFV